MLNSPTTQPTAYIATSVMRVVKMGNIAPRAGIKPRLVEFRDDCPNHLDFLMSPPYPTYVFTCLLPLEVSAYYKLH